MFFESCEGENDRARMRAGLGGSEARTGRISPGARLWESGGVTSTGGAPFATKNDIDFLGGVRAKAPGGCTGGTSGSGPLSVSPGLLCKVSESGSNAPPVRRGGNVVFETRVLREMDRGCLWSARAPASSLLLADNLDCLGGSPLRTVDMYV